MDDAKKVWELDEFVCFAIYSAGHAVNRLYKPLLDEIGLTYPQYLAMTALWAHDDQTVGALGEKLFLESSTLTPLLKRLEAMGLVSRRRDKDDERQVRVALTPEGAAMQKQACTIPERLLAQTDMSPEDLVKLRDDVARIRDVILDGMKSG